jgi:hypothetical protein
MEGEGRTRVRENERNLETPTKDAKGTKASTKGGGRNTEKTQQTTEERRRAKGRVCRIHIHRQS